MILPTFALDARLIEGTNTGDSTYWTCLVQALSRLPAKAQFLLYSNKPKPENIPEQENLHWIHLEGASSRWWSMVQFPLAARKQRISGIHTQYGLSPLAGKIGISTIHDVSFLIEPSWFSRKDRTLLTLGVKSAAKRARAIIAVSETDRREIETHLPNARGKTVVTYNACPPWITRRDRREAKSQVKNLFGIDRPYLLTIGTRWPRKNMELVVQAASNLDPAFPHRLAIVGKGNWSSQELGARGFVTGYIPSDQLSWLYSAATIYLAPSRHEGFGIPILEAFKCGCPVLCSSGGAFPEVAAAAAWVEPSWNASDWTDSIERLLRDSSKLKTLSQAGIRREEAFSWIETARRTLEIYLDKT